MNIAVIGAGAIGGWVASRLALAGHRLIALSSRGPVDAFILREGGTARKAGFEGFDGPADAVILSVKTVALEQAAEAAARWIGPRTLVLPMVNGVPWWFAAHPLLSVDPNGRIARALPAQRLLGCVVHASCRRTAPAEVELVHCDTLILGEPDGGTSERTERLCRMFEDAGIACRQSDDVRSAIWYKLWGNATINPLSALTRSTADRLLGDPDIRAFMGEAMDELSTIGAAVGCPIEESVEDRMAVTARLGAFKTSMLQDVEAGRPLELEALLGAPIELARRAGLATPRLDLLYAMTALLAR